MKLSGKEETNHSLLLKVLFIYFLIFAVPIILLHASLYGTSSGWPRRRELPSLLSLTSISNTMGRGVPQREFRTVQAPGQHRLLQRLFPS